jgi:hypothetical protein
LNTTVPTPRRRLELAVVVGFGLALAAVPACVPELYPFSRAPMFSDAPARYCRYAIYGPAGEPLPLDSFGLQRNYWGNPPVGSGFLPPPSLDRFGEVPAWDLVTSHVRGRLTSRPDLPFVTITRAVIGPMDGGTVGPVRLESRRVDNPRRSPP